MSSVLRRRGWWHVVPTSRTFGVVRSMRELQPVASLAVRSIPIVPITIATAGVIDACAPVPA